jgi:hypothetical protein
MNTEEHDDLWQLLGKAKQPAVSPFFSRNVLREIRATEQDAPRGLFSWFRLHWRPAAVAASILLLFGGNIAKQQHEEHQVLSLAATVSESPDYQVIAHLDELLDSEQNSLWLDNNNVY